MTIAAAVKRLLDQQGITYRIAHHCRTITLEEAAYELGIQPHQIARAVLLKDHLGILMAILPLNYRLDSGKLQKMLQRKLKVLSGREADQIFKDCEPGSRPPVPDAYGISCVVDSSLLNCGDIYFEPGTHHAIVHVSQSDYRDLLTNALKGRFSFQERNDTVALTGKQKGSATCAASFEAIQSRLPRLAKPELLTPLLMHFQHEMPFPEDLTTKLLAEPNLAFFISEFFARVKPGEYPSDFTKLLRHHYQDKQVIALMIGIVIANYFNMPSSGPFANRNVWLQGLLAAWASSELAETVSSQLDVDKKNLFLGALLQNTGLLLMGYLYPPEYRLLNRLALANPHCHILQLEQRLLGMGCAHQVMALGHEKLGGWLLNEWQLPDQVVDIVQQHHNPLYSSHDRGELHIVQFINNLLVEQGVSQDPMLPFFMEIQNKLLIENGCVSIITNKINKYITPIQQLLQETLHQRVSGAAAL